MAAKRPENLMPGDKILAWGPDAEVVSARPVEVGDADDQVSTTPPRVEVAARIDTPDGPVVYVETYPLGVLIEVAVE